MAWKESVLSLLPWGLRVPSWNVVFLVRIFQLSLIGARLGKGCQLPCVVWEIELIHAQLSPFYYNFLKAILSFWNMTGYCTKLIPSHLHPNLWSEGHRFRLFVRRTRMFSEFTRVIFVRVCNRKVIGLDFLFREVRCFPSFAELPTEVETIWSSCRWMLERGHTSTLRHKVPWRTQW